MVNQLQQVRVSNEGNADSSDSCIISRLDSIVIVIMFASDSHYSLDVIPAFISHMPSLFNLPSCAPPTLSHTYTHTHHITPHLCRQECENPPCPRPQGLVTAGAAQERVQSIHERTVC
jgi:hypothetical protein